MDFFTLCRLLKQQFIQPASPQAVETAIATFTSDLCPEVKQQGLDFLHRFWKNNGWKISETGAVKIKPKEEACFHSDGVTIIHWYNEQTKEIAFTPIRMHKQHCNVVWFV